MAGIREAIKQLDDRMKLLEALQHKKPTAPSEPQLDPQPVFPKPDNPRPRRSRHER